MENENVCTATFKGECTREVLWVVLDHLDGMKTRGFHFIKHEREDLPNGNVKIDYVLSTK